MDNQIHILVTGATGFIGSHLTRRLVKEGYNVGIIKRESSDLWRIRDIIPNLTVFDIDIADSEKIFTIISDFNPEIVFHLAAKYAVDHNPSDVKSMVDTNLSGIINLLEASSQSSVSHFINTSSCFVYQNSDKKSNETDPLDPFNLYALTKIQAEEACNFYMDKYGLKTTTLRIFPPYGPHDNDRRLIPSVIKNLLEGKKLELTSGLQKWDFIYVEDIIDAYMSLIGHNFRDHEIFNIGTGNPTTITEVVNEIQESLGITSTPNWGAIPNRKNELWFNSADITKAEKMLNWKPRTTLQEGIKLTVDWYKTFWDYRDTI